MEVCAIGPCSSHAVRATRAVFRLTLCFSFINILAEFFLDYTYMFVRICSESLTVGIMDKSRVRN